MRVAVATAVRSAGRTVVLPLAGCRRKGTLLPDSGLDTEYGSDGLLVVLVTGLGAVSGDPAGELVRGVQGAGCGTAVAFLAGDADRREGRQGQGSGMVVTWYSRKR